MALAKPLPYHFPRPGTRRLQGKSKAMTLIAAFRCRDNGILLCADREESDNISKRPFEKIYRISELPECQFFIAGSGTTTAITDSWAEIHRTLGSAVQQNRSILADHRSLIETSLAIIHQRHEADLTDYPLGLLVVVSPRNPKSAPIIYRSEKTNLISVGDPQYIAYGTGAPISDYLSDRLYKHGLPDTALITLAAFILREAAQSAPGVGLGNDMYVICPGGSLFKFIPTDRIAELQAGIPSLKDSIYSHWPGHVKVPTWLHNYAAREPTE